MGKQKERLDQILVKRGFFHSRSRAAAAVLEGQVSVNGKKIEKPGTPVADDVEIGVVEGPRYVSRGGMKLEQAFDEFGLDVRGKVVLDAGASTGGFTDCLLKHGARKVIAVDVGYGQFDWSLRRNQRVELRERTNIRYIRPEMLSETPDIATLDLSFISLKKVLSAVIKCLRPGFEIIALVKPQFEAGKGMVGKGGVVRERTTHRQVLTDIWQHALDNGCVVRGITASRVRGPRGNVEYLLYLTDGSFAAMVAEAPEESVLEGLLKDIPELS